MLKIRLQRVGRKHDPSYRIVATNSRTGPKSNKHAAILGHYDAIRKTKSFDEEAIKSWIDKGAQFSDTVYNMLVKEGVIKGQTRNALPKKTPIVSEQPEEETPAQGVDTAVEEKTEEATDAPAEETAAETTGEEATEESDKETK
tara:strand:+ start:435 stop:866 length:432 start_codon:yes stop_codon:yes gene_type:complete